MSKKPRRTEDPSMPATTARVLASLPDKPAKADEWADVEAVANVTGIRQATVTTHLRKLVASGAAEVYDQGRGKPKLYRRTPARRAQRAARGTTDQVAGVTSDTQQTPASDPLSAPASGSVGDVAAFMSSNRPVSAPPAPAPRRATCTAPGCGESIVKDGRSWKHEEPARDAGHKATTAQQREPRPAREPRVSGNGGQSFKTWGKGELKDTVLAWLQGRADEVFGATGVAHAVSGQVGSVQFALDRLVDSGHAKLAQDKPKRYQAA